MVRIGLCHHKCGTAYLQPLFIDICKRLTFTMIVKDKIDFINSKNSDSKTFIFFMNSVYKRHVEPLRLKNYRAFHVVRDPRDIIVSGYFSHLYSHSIEGPENRWLIPIRELLQKIPLEEGLLHEIEKGYALNEISEWNYENPNIIEIKVEDLLMCGPDMSLKVVSDILKHLRMDFMDERALKEMIIKHHAWYSGRRKAGVEDPRDHYRKGEVGDWRNYFTSKHVDHFKQKWGSLLIKLGYEKNNDWSL